MISIPRFTFISIILFIFLKIFLFILIKNDYLIINLGGGNDAQYYDSYAKGNTNLAVNIWPVILRYANGIGIYSREIISYFFLFLNLFIIPILVCKLAEITFRKNKKYYLYLYLICLIYPTIYFYTLDIYRDVFMVFSFLISCILAKKTFNSPDLFAFTFYFVLSIIAGIFLIGLRPYLGYSFILSLLLWKIKLTKKRLIVLGFLYFTALFIANYLGILDFLTDYRSSFEDKGGESTLNLDFSNPIMFIPNFVISTLGQLFGLYITNALAIVIFLIETIPFFFMLVYVIKNIKTADNFLRFLIIFFILYASVWLIGNDNLGTALRLRMYNYLAIYICFFHIIKLKKNLKLREYRGV